VIEKRHAIRLVLSTALALAPVAGWAQTGHPPGNSPYRDILPGKTLTLFGGYMFGTGGSLGIAPHDGSFGGIRFDIRVSSPLSLALSFQYGGMQRNYVDLASTTADYLKGPIAQDVFMGEMGLQFNVTGKKSWHRLAPFMGFTLGLASANRSSVDHSGYTFGTRFEMSPQWGTRIALSNRLILRAEMRWIFWGVSYPSTYRVPLPGYPVVVTTEVSKWTSNTALSLGVGFGF
jgi:hypothetical protein